MKVTNNRCPVHSGLRDFCNNYVVFMSTKNFLRTFKNTISYGQAREPTNLLFSLLVNLTEMFPKNNLQKIRRCNLHISICQMPISKQNNILTASCFGKNKYMYIGNRHQRQWWICVGVWATWHCLMGLIRQAARAGSRSRDDAALDVNGPVTYFPWLHHPGYCLVVGAVLLSSVSAGCDLISRVHSELKPGGLNLPA